MVDNVNCPCCYRCARQHGQFCNVDTEKNHDVDYNYCDAGLQCKGAIVDRTTGRLLGRCEGRRSQQCLYGQVHKKGCLTCECVNGSERCWDDGTSGSRNCSKPDCPWSQRYRPVDQCCFVCRDRIPEPNPFCDPKISLLGDSAVITTTRRDTVSVVFLGNCLALVNKSAQLSVFHDGSKLESANLLVTLPRPHDPDAAVQITFVIKNVKKKHAGEYILRYGNASDVFTLIVQNPGLLSSCTFDSDFCNWRSKTSPVNSGIGWWRECGPAAPGRGPQAGHGGSGCYIYVQASVDVEGHKAILRSLQIPATYHPEAMTFSYYMEGSSVGSLTVVQILFGVNDTTQRIEKWSNSGNKEGGWNTVTLSIKPMSYRRSKIEFIAYAGQRGHIALDSIEFLY